MAISIETPPEAGEKTATLDTYTKDLHIRYFVGDASAEEAYREPITIGKIPVVYLWRNRPIWENTSNIVYEMEWSLSRNANYIRKNSTPILMVKAGRQIDFGEERSELHSFRTVEQLPPDGGMEYVTWTQSTESLKLQLDQLEQKFFTMLQIPNLSFDNLIRHQMSGEALKQLLRDGELKVQDESGALLEFFAREANLLKAFVKTFFQVDEAAADDLTIKQTITPYTIHEERDTLQNLALAVQSGLISKEEAIGRLGWSGDPKETLRMIAEEATQDLMNPTL